MVFASKHPDLRIRATRLGRTLVFKKGRYETDDPAEIAALERNPYVTEGAPERESKRVVETRVVRGDDGSDKDDDADNPPAD